MGLRRAPLRVQLHINHQPGLLALTTPGTVPPPSPTPDRPSLVSFPLPLWPPLHSSCPQ